MIQQDLGIGKIVRLTSPPFVKIIWYIAQMHQKSKFFFYFLFKVLIEIQEVLRKEHFHGILSFIHCRFDT